RILNGPLQPGAYRFTATRGLTDRAGNPLATNFVRYFTVEALAPFTVENRDNDGQPTATLLTLVEDPPGLRSGQGRGNLWSCSDADWWAFSATNGEVVTFAVENPGNPGSSSLRFDIYRPNGSFWARFYGDGSGRNQSVVSLPDSGTYTVQVLC